jgi:hypothetical protein
VTVRLVEVRTTEVRPRFDLVAVDLHDNHATGQSAALPEWSSRGSRPVTVSGLVRLLGFNCCNKTIDRHMDRRLKIGDRCSGWSVFAELSDLA